MGRHVLHVGVNGLRDCLQNNSIQIPQDMLGFQHGDRPHVSNYDKLWIKIYLNTNKDGRGLFLGQNFDI